MKNPKRRRCEILVRGKWEQIHFKDMLPGDLFRLFEPDGTPVDDGEVSVAASAVREEGEDNWGVQQEPAGRVMSPGSSVGSERLTTNQEAAGSSPARGTKFSGQVGQG